jgi:hypothetical protein
MKLALVLTRGLLVSFKCVRCNGHCQAVPFDQSSAQYPPHRLAYADREGEPFKAYYCGKCKEEVENGTLSSS